MAADQAIEMVDVDDFAIGYTEKQI